jgi:GT2 family glycosyltransferase
LSFRAVIVNFRRHDLVAACIRALQSGTRPPDEIVVVDNQADDAALAVLAEQHPDVVLIANRENAGYARACNQGAAGALTDYVLFINPDVTVEGDCMERCLEAAEADPAIGIVTPRLVRPDGRLDHACHRGIPTPSASLAYALRLHRRFPASHWAGRYTMSWLDPRTDHDVEACTGAFMLVRRGDLQAVGGWDERYWFYAEDLDLCVRIARIGQRVRYLGSATATHIKGASSGLHSRTGPPDRATLAQIRGLQRAIVESHSLFFRENLRGSTAVPVALAIQAMFSAQRLRLRLAVRLDALRGT